MRAAARALWYRAKYRFRNREGISNPNNEVSRFKVVRLDFNKLSG